MPLPNLSMYAGDETEWVILESMQRGEAAIHSGLYGPDFCLML